MHVLRSGDPFHELFLFLFAVKLEEDLLLLVFQKIDLVYRWLHHEMILWRQCLWWRAKHIVNHSFGIITPDGSDLLREYLGLVHLNLPLILNRTLQLILTLLISKSGRATLDLVIQSLQIESPFLSRFCATTAWLRPIIYQSGRYLSPLNWI